MINTRNNFVPTTDENIVSDTIVVKYAPCLLTTFQAMMTYIIAKS